ncbi:hypothetical protein [Rahnella aceris]
MMAFRADDATKSGYDRALSYLIPKEFDAEEKIKSKKVFDEIIEKYGPVIDSYPTWHPIVSGLNSRDGDDILPTERSGFSGLDHTIYLANGFITCPYVGEDELIESVSNLEGNSGAYISARKLDVMFYHEYAKPVLVYCTWKKSLSLDGTIPKNIAIPLLLEREVPCWQWSELAESWETMRPYFLGSPAGGRSSLFVNQETGQAIKNIWNAIIKTGMFGNVKV